MLTQFAALGVICGGLLSLLGLLAGIWRWLIVPTWRLFQHLDKLANELLGDPDEGVPSMMDRMATLENRLAEHQQWHLAAERIDGRRAGGGHIRTTRGNT